MGALRRTAPLPSSRPFSKRLRDASCGVMARESSTHRGGAEQKPSAPCPMKYTKVIRNGVVVEMEAMTVGGSEIPPKVRPILKVPRAVQTATCGDTMVREKPARRSGNDEEELSVPSPKRAKAETAKDPALGTLRKRMAAELDALQALLRKAELLSSGKNDRSMAAKQRSEAPVESSIKTPPEKRRKVSAFGKIAEFESQEDENVVDICGGVSPVAIQNASPVVAVDKAGETGNIEGKEPPEDGEICNGVSPVVFVEKAGETGNSEGKEPPEDGEICDDVSPVVSVEKAGESGTSPSSSSDSGSSSSSDSDSDIDSASSSSSDSDSDSDSESDTDETVDMPVPPAALPDKNGASAQAPPEPASEVVHTAEPEELHDESVNIPVPQAVLPEKSGKSVQPSPEPASEVVQSKESVKLKDKNRAAPTAISMAALIAKGKVRRKLLEMERAVLPDESIHPRDLKDLSILEYGRPSIMRHFGLFLKADA